ncbi:hypothetical protein IV500_04630 [Paeniglutamicibacter antarcticus]|uniref:Uncharacterized protein n=1 Tax=Arthrobacter terrae TaxID=2935737 RepID=A0A931G4E0_9MICC|nr:hypothetical protein [Arthrobacter terrae]MBG0738703.1 hypothetical protein [Arthrobacter terrae]
MIYEERLFQILMLWIGIVVAFFGLLLVFRIVGLARVRKNFSKADMDKLREELVDYMSAKSRNRRQLLPLKPFWKGRHLTRTARWVVVRPLLREGILWEEAPVPTSKASQDNTDVIVQVSTSRAEIFMRWWVPRPPPKVYLSDLDWEAMKHGHLSARKLLEDRNVIIVGHGTHLGDDIHYDASTHTTTVGRDYNHVETSGGSRADVHM